MAQLSFAISAVLLFYGYSQTRHSRVEGYTIVAKFSKADGLVEGSDVKIGGIKVGSVSQMTLDPQRYTAIVKMQINNDIKIPTDTSAAIISQSLLGVNT
ncbi:MAG: MCE family protein [Holosporaceae bacterium]|nr:MAG: MCE family protein [Holosporaceae bacterium]